MAAVTTAYRQIYETLTPCSKGIYRVSEELWNRIDELTEVPKDFPEAVFGNVGFMREGKDYLLTTEQYETLKTAINY